MPRLPDAGPDEVLLERDTELETIGALVDAARLADGSLVVIEGTAGIGKTRLLAEARRRAGADMRVLSARGGEYEADFPFGVVRQLFEPLLATVSAETRAELLAGAATLAEPVFQTATLATQHDPERETSFAILHGLYWLASNVAAEQPTMLALDDLHWADSPSLRWLCYLAHRLEGLPLLVVLATRPPEQARDPGLLTELVADASASSIRPGPLTRESIEALVRRRFGEDPDPEFVRAVDDATRGNPLLVVALLDTVAREGFAPRADQAHVLLELGPRVVGRAVSLRLARLPAEARSLLEAAAILGDGTELRHVATLAALGLAPAGRAARLLVHADLLLRDDPVEFFHPVVRTAIYESVDALARSDGHRRAAQILVEAGAPAERAAAHLLATAPAGEAFVVDTLRAAARRALGQGAAEVAAGYLARALEEGPDESTRAEALVELGLAKRLIDGPAAAEHLREGLELLTDERRRAEAALELGGVLFFLNREAEAIAVFERALAETSLDEHPELHERLAAEYVSTAWWAPETLPLAEARLREIDLERLHGGLGSDVLLAVTAFYQLRLAEDREATIANARRALASGNLVASGALGFHFATLALVGAGMFDEALAAYDVSLAAAQRRGDVFRAAPLLAFRGRAKIFSGDLEGAITDLTDGYESVVAHGVQVGLPYASGFLAHALLERGDVDEAARVIERAQLPEDLPLNANLFFFHLARGRTRLAKFEPQEGAEDLLELGRRTRILLFDNPAGYPWRLFAARGLLDLGRDNEARALANENVELARRWGAPHAIGAALRTIALFETGAKREATLREAVEILAGAPARLEYARAICDLGAALVPGKSRAEARELLRQGVELANRAGSQWLAWYANEKLAASGARPHRPVAGGRESLTASERRVAELAARDRSNKEIAQELFVTVKTVELHLSNVYRKLKIASRRQLAEALEPQQSDALSASA